MEDKILLWGNEWITICSTSSPIKGDSMCTKPRIVASNLVYEISSRGARNTKIFFNDELKEFFLKELEYTLKKFSFKCYAWNVLDDHYHIVIRSSAASISIFMQRLNSIYAKYFNKVTSGSGVVFHKRFVSVIIEDTKLKKLIRYVHLNPVRAGMCTIDELANYKWCGHGNIINNVQDHFQNVNEVLRMFSDSESSNVYEAYVRDTGIDTENDLTIKLVRMANNGVQSFSKSEPWILGSAEFIQYVLEKDRCRRLRIARFIQENMTLERIQIKIEEYLKLSNGSLFRQGRLSVKATARCIFSYIGKFRYDFSMVKLANYLNVSYSAISKMIARYFEQPQRNAAVKDLFKELNVEQSLEVEVTV